MHGQSVIVRRLSSGIEVEQREWQAVYNLCCATGADGQPIALDRWKFFGTLWIGPYKKLLPEWTYVAQASGAVVGYLTGCPNTREFARSKLLRSSLPLFLDIALGRYYPSGDTRRFIRRAFGFEKGPEHCFSRATVETLAREYPAHLHMNVAPAYRGVGVGKHLIGTFCADLRSVGVSGVHVYCGSGPRTFYLARGFKDLDSILFNGVTVHALGYRS